MTETDIIIDTIVDIIVSIIALAVFFGGVFLIVNSNGLRSARILQGSDLAKACVFNGGEYIYSLGDDPWEVKERCSISK